MSRQTQSQKQIDGISPITTHNLFKNKNNNTQSHQENKTNSSFQSHFKPNLKKRATERSSLEDVGVLMQKQVAGNGNGDTQSNLRNVIREEENKLGKPFTIKYISSSQNNIQPKSQFTPDSKRHKNQQIQSNQLIQQPKNRTKESFNKKLTNNIIKDQQQDIFSKYKVQPDTRQPKIIKKQLINLNKSQNLIQHQILELHKENKEYLANMSVKYKINYNNIERYVSKRQYDKNQSIFDILQQKLKENRLKYKKYEKIIEGNEYLQFVKKLPEDILEQDDEQDKDSQYQDSVEDLPAGPPKLQGNQGGSYSTAMSEVKDKKFGLNARRTYDYFKQNTMMKESKISAVTSQSKQQRSSQYKRSPQHMISQQAKNNDDGNGENKVTVNNKFKDFLLN